MKTIYTFQALSDFDDIFNYISSDSLLRAEKYIYELKLACEKIAYNPSLYPIYKRKFGVVFRKKVFENYLIYYHFDETTVTIQRILHGARIQKL